jgi:hypothetical protein
MKIFSEVFKPLLVLLLRELLPPHNELIIVNLSDLRCLLMQQHLKIFLKIKQL